MNFVLKGLLRTEPPDPQIRMSGTDQYYAPSPKTSNNKFGFYVLNIGPKHNSKRGNEEISVNLSNTK